MNLSNHQVEAIEQMKNGCILVGDTGAGKSRTAVAYYYFKVIEGSIQVNGSGYFQFPKKPRDLYIITTAKKRDSIDWNKELIEVCLLAGENKEFGVNVHIDSWNNIAKYKKVYGAFFIFDEQRVTGWGKWSKTFVAISRKNQWILLTATPGDKWTDYIPVFIANGFYRTVSEFKQEHCVYNTFNRKYPEIVGYKMEGILTKHRNDIQIIMHDERNTVRHRENITCGFDKLLYKRVWKDRWDPYENRPIEESGKLLYLLRKVVNGDESRLDALRGICESHDKVVVFYNYTYELYMLRKLFDELGFSVGEWNGEVHSQIPKSDRWAYLVQYIAGCEGWNCIETDTLIFYSLSYSYRMTLQAEGRIDRMNTPFTDLYYYYLRSPAPIDLAIMRALKDKRDFNEKNFIKKIPAN